MTKSDDKERQLARRERKREVGRSIEEFRERIGATNAPALTPQAIHHWNRNDQINALIEAGELEPDLGFIVRLLALCTLPRTNPGSRDRYVRRNGPFTLIMIAGGEVPQLPYGTLPRLLLAWMCTEAVRTQSRTLVLGRSLAEFMRQIGVQSSDSGGRWGVRTRLRNQMDRLFRASVELSHESEQGLHRVADHITSETHLWWNPRRPDEPVFWNSTIELGEKFFAEIIDRPLPIDLNVLRAMKRSSLGLDIYLWLTYRLFRLNGPMRLTWRQLHWQFGANPGKTDKVTILNFRKKVLRELGKLKNAWPGLDYRIPRGYLELRPTAARIPPAISTDQV